MASHQVPLVELECASHLHTRYTRLCVAVPIALPLVPHALVLSVLFAQSTRSVVQEHLEHIRATVM